VGRECESTGAAQRGTGARRHRVLELAWPGLGDKYAASSLSHVSNLDQKYRKKYAHPHGNEKDRFQMTTFGRFFMSNIYNTPKH